MKEMVWKIAWKYESWGAAYAAFSRSYEIARENKVGAYLVSRDGKWHVLAEGKRAPLSEELRKQFDEVNAGGELVNSAVAATF